MTLVAQAALAGGSDFQRLTYALEPLSSERMADEVVQIVRPSARRLSDQRGTVDASWALSAQNNAGAKALTTARLKIPTQSVQETWQ